MSKIRDRLKSEVWFPARGLSVFVAYCAGCGVDVEKTSDETLDQLWARFQLEATDLAIHEVGKRPAPHAHIGAKFVRPEWLLKCM